LFILV